MANKPLTSFFIADILSGRAASVEYNQLNVIVNETAPRQRSQERSLRNPAGTPPNIKRPWDDGSSRSSGEYSSDVDEGVGGLEGEDDEEDIDVDDVKPPPRKSVCPLDALLKMTSKTFDANARSEHDDGKYTCL